MTDISITGIVDWVSSPPRFRSLLRFGLPAVALAVAGGWTITPLTRPDHDPGLSPPLLNSNLADPPVRSELQVGLASAASAQKIDAAIVGLQGVTRQPGPLPTNEGLTHLQSPPCDGPQPPAQKVQALNRTNIAVDYELRVELLDDDGEYLAQTISRANNVPPGTLATLDLGTATSSEPAEECILLSFNVTPHQNIDHLTLSPQSQ